MSYQVSAIENLSIVRGDIRSRFTIDPEDGRTFDVFAVWDPVFDCVKIEEAPESLEDEELQEVEDAIYFFLFDPTFDLS